MISRSNSLHFLYPGVSQQTGCGSMLGQDRESSTAGAAGRRMGAAVATNVVRVEAALGMRPMREPTELDTEQTIQASSNCIAQARRAAIGLFAEGATRPAFSSRLSI